MHDFRSRRLEETRWDEVSDSLLFRLQPSDNFWVDWSKFKEGLGVEEVSLIIVKGSRINGMNVTIWRVADCVAAHAVIRGEVECRTVEFVRTRLRHGVDCTAGEAVEFRIHRRRFNLQRRNSVEGNW